MVTVVINSPEEEQVINKSLNDLCSKYSYSYKDVLNYAFTVKVDLPSDKKN